MSGSLKGRLPVQLVGISFLFFRVLLFMISPEQLLAGSGIQWSKCYGGKWADKPTGIFALSDGGFLFFGTSNSDDGDIQGNSGGEDLWVVKLTSTGKIEWQRALKRGRYGPDFVCPTRDGGCICRKVLDENCEVISDLYHQRQYGLIKLDSQGKTVWEIDFQKEGEQWVYPQIVCESSDGNLGILGEINEIRAGSTLFLMKTDGNGKEQWRYRFGGDKKRNGSLIKPTSDGGLVGAGHVDFGENNLNPGRNSPGLIFNSRRYNPWVFSINRTGEFLWERTYGGSCQDSAKDLFQTQDGGFQVWGWASSNDGDVKLNLSFMGKPWLIKIDSKGALEWETSISPLNRDPHYYSSFLRSSRDGGLFEFEIVDRRWNFKKQYYETAEWLKTVKDELADDSLPLEIWVNKYNEKWELSWRQYFGKSRTNKIADAQETTDGGFIIIGETDGSKGKGSFDGYHNYRIPTSLWHPYHGTPGPFEDIWVAKLSLQEKAIPLEVLPPKRK